MEKTQPECIFCDYCGERIGWAESADDVHTKLVCDGCKKDRETI